MDEISENCNGQFNLEVRPGKSFAFRHPFRMLIAGPTCCGKTTWMKNLLHQDETMILPAPRKTVWFYKRWQPAYSQLEETIPYIEFVEGIQLRDPDGQPSIYHQEL